MFHERDHRLAKSELSGNWTWNSCRDGGTSPFPLWPLSVVCHTHKPARKDIQTPLNNYCALMLKLSFFFFYNTMWATMLNANIKRACLSLTKWHFHQVFYLQSLEDIIKITLRYFEIYMILCWNTFALKNLFFTQQSTFAIFVSLPSILPTKGV